jgi:uncharacterized LabA/DUF88 family protein
MSRVSFFIDGFNLYHSIKDFAKDSRWLSLKKLCETYLKDGEQLVDIYYFTAIAEWNREKAEKHRNYIRMLEKEGVKVVYGKFKKVSRHCNICQKLYPTHEEKRTDVNIALKLFLDAMRDKFDTAMLVSGDSDLIPPITAIRDNFLNKRVGVIIPVGRKAKELKDTADFNYKMEKSRLYDSLLDEDAEIRGMKITAPKGWLPSKK